MTEERLYEISEVPGLENPSLVVGWSQDAGRLSPVVVDFLVSKLGAEACAAIEPLPFFPLRGVSIENGVIQFPESRFYCCRERNLLIFKSEIPGKEHYLFLNAVLDIARHYGVKEMYTIGGIISPIAHAGPRKIFTVVNQAPLKATLTGCGVDTGLDYDTHSGGRPTVSSYLLWLAEKRRLAGVGLWAEVPFYLAATSDPIACRELLVFLDKRLGLGMDFLELDLAIARQEEALVELKQQSAAATRSLDILEKGIVLSAEEQERLTAEVTEFLARRVV